MQVPCVEDQADGKGIGLRFPRFLRIRDDKTPEDDGSWPTSDGSQTCEESTGSEQIVEMFEAQASVSGTAAAGSSC